jgi:Uncharacterised nucleotidyltransferase
MKRFDAFLFICRSLSVPIGSESARRSVRDEILNSRMNWEKVVEIAGLHFVTPALYLSLKSMHLLDELPADLRDYFITVYDLNRDRNLRLIEQTLHVSERLNAIGIEPVLLKGMANLISGLYDDTGQRMVRDIDLLVSRDRLTDCIAVLKADGYRCIKDNPLFEMHHYPAMVRKEDIASVELHEYVVRRLYEKMLPADEILSAARRFEADGVYMQLMDPDHHVAHNIVHSQLHDGGYIRGFVSIRDLFDLFCLEEKRSKEIDWRRVADRFDRTGYGEVFRTYLDMARRLFEQSWSDVVPEPMAEGSGLGRLKLQIEHQSIHAIFALYNRYTTTLHRAGLDREFAKSLIRRLLTPSWYADHIKSLSTFLQGRR